MSTLKIIGGFTVAATIAAIASVAAISNTGNKNMEIPKQKIAKTAHSISFDSSGKFGSEYYKYLIGTGENSKEDGNERYKEIEHKKPKTGRFSSIDKGYGNDNKSLSKVCSEAYKVDPDYMDDDEEEDYFIKAEVWRFCSRGGTGPKTVDEVHSESYRGGTFGQDQSEYLLSITDPEAQGIWDLKNQRYEFVKVFDGFFKTFKEQNN